MWWLCRILASELSRIEAPALPSETVNYAARVVSTGRGILRKLEAVPCASLPSLRMGCSNVTSVRMDDQTLFAHRDLWAPEPKPAVGTYPTLTAGEFRALEDIRAEGNIRL
jgi:hypothetical protein